MEKGEFRARTYRRLLSSMVGVRDHVVAGRVRRPDGAVSACIMMERLEKFLRVDPTVEIDEQMRKICNFVGLTADEIHYLADVGQWILTERDTREMDTEEEEDFWAAVDNHPTLDFYFRMTRRALDQATRDEIEALDALYYEAKN